MANRTQTSRGRWRIPLGQVRRRMWHYNFTPDGQALNIGESSSTVTLNDGENVIPLSVDYIATGTATAGNVTATATFSMVYS